MAPLVLSQGLRPGPCGPPSEPPLRAVEQGCPSDRRHGPAEGSHRAGQALYAVVLRCTYGVYAVIVLTVVERSCRPHSVPVRSETSDPR